MATGFEISYLYSVLRLRTGFLMADLKAWKLMVTTAIINAITEDSMNIHAPSLMRYAKSCSHTFIIHHATGIAMMIAIATSFTKSFVSNTMMFVSDAPSTFLIPIS